MIECREIPGTNIVEVTSEGGFTLQEHSAVHAQIEAAIRRHGKIRMLVVGNPKQSIDRDVRRQDRSFGRAHTDDCERWASVGRAIMGLLVRILNYEEMRLFARGDIEHARQWLNEDRPRIEVLQLAQSKDEAIAGSTGWKGAVRSARTGGRVVLGTSIAIGVAMGLFARRLSLTWPWLGLALFVLFLGWVVASLCVHIVTAGRTLNAIRSRGFEVSIASDKEVLKKWGHPSPSLPWKVDATKVAWTVLCTVEGKRVSTATRCSSMNQRGKRGEAIVATVRLNDPSWRFICGCRSRREPGKRSSDALHCEIGWEQIFKERNRQCHAKVQVGCLNWKPAAMKLLADGPKFESWVCADGLLHCIWAGRVTAIGFERLLKRPVEFLEAIESGPTAFSLNP